MELTRVIVGNFERALKGTRIAFYGHSICSFSPPRSTTSYKQVVTIIYIYRGPATITIMWESHPPPFMKESSPLLWESPPSPSLWGRQPCTAVQASDCSCTPTTVASKHFYTPHFRYHILIGLLRRIFFCSCRTPYSSASAVGGQPGT